MKFLSSISDMYFFSLTYISEEHLLGPPINFGSLGISDVFSSSLFSSTFYVFEDLTTASLLINFGSGISKDSSLDKDIISAFLLSNLSGTSIDSDLLTALYLVNCGISIDSIDSLLSSGITYDFFSSSSFYFYNRICSSICLAFISSSYV